MRNARFWNWKPREFVVPVRSITGSTWVLRAVRCGRVDRCRRRLRCVACLEKFVHEIQVPAFAIHTELRGPETVDLTPFMREDLLLNLPAHPHCDRDAGRVCKPKQIQASEQDTKRKSDWSALDQLKLKG